MRLTKKFGLELDTKEGLEKLYNTYTAKDICTKYKINSKLLFRRLKLFGISTKPKIKDIISKERLEQLYHKQKLSMTEMSKLLNVSRREIIKLFKHYKIKTRSFREASLLRSKIISKRMKELWKDPEYLKKMTTNIGFSSPRERLVYMAKNQLGKISSIQKILYSILDDLNIEYEREKILGYWAYDCYIPKHNLIIECQGTYWHSKKDVIIRDEMKATYLEKYYPHIKLKHIWEHEFMCKDRIIDLIKYWTGISKSSIINYEFNDVQIKPIDNTLAKLFIAKYHYFGRIGKNSIIYGAFYENILIAICAFASITRNETAIRLQTKSKHMKELTRFCIHPQYQKKNLASWFMSRCVKKLKKDMPKIQKLVAFSDMSFNHHGTIYKVTNWIEDGKIKPDYWYINNDGYVMHKKTLWDHAQKMGISESEYAIQYNYRKVMGKSKFRFIYNY